jgi:hypothetical protein
MFCYLAPVRAKATLHPAGVRLLFVDDFYKDCTPTECKPGCSLCGTCGCEGIGIKQVSRCVRSGSRWAPDVL